MIKDNDKNKGLELFANFVNSLEEPEALNFTWQPIPRSFSLNELGPKLRQLGVEAIPEDALFSPAKITDFETELDQLIEAEKRLKQGVVQSPILVQSSERPISFFKSELWRPRDETRKPFLGVLRSPRITVSQYRLIMSSLISDVNRVRYINNQQPIPVYPPS